METLEKFFQRYSNLSQGTDQDPLAACYAEHLIAAGPGTLMAFDNDKEFIEWLKAVQEFNHKSGMQNMQPVKISGSAIGEAYTNATVTWSVVFAAKKDKAVEFDITYILSKENNTYKIVAFFSHEDQEDVMKKHGIS